MEETNKEIAGIGAIMVDKSDDEHRTSIKIGGKAFDILELLSDITESLVKNEVEIKDILWAVTLGFDKANAS